MTNLNANQANAAAVTVHDFTGQFSGDVYDRTQTDTSIKDGDVLDLGSGNVAILVKPWPTIVAGEIEHFHSLKGGATFETFEGGQYAASAAKAREVAQIGKLSAEFTRVVCESLTPDQMQSVRRINEERNDPHTCATHDFCDANMLMEEAWVSVVGELIDVNDEAQSVLWDKAWALSKANGFKTNDLLNIAPASEQGNVQKFASGDWMNLFGPGSKETRCRIVIDLEQSTLIAAQEWTGLKFEDVLGNRLEGLADSVLGANEAHDNPADWGLEVSVAMPDWAGPVMAQGKVAESGFDDEIIVKLADGCTLRSGVDDPDAEGALTAGDYVRLCGPDGEEIHFWSKDEWQTDPSLVMGAIMIAAAGNRLQPSVAVEDSPSPGK